LPFGKGRSGSRRLFEIGSDEFHTLRSSQWSAHAVYDVLRGNLVIIVAGHLRVDSGQREAYLRTCAEVVEQARQTAGCLDFSVTGDLLDGSRVNVFERWESLEQVEAFRGDGVGGEQGALIVEAHVAEYEVGQVRSLTD
jgi:quinol monooxygenase YgiN